MTAGVVRIKPLLFLLFAALFILWSALQADAVTVKLTGADPSSTVLLHVGDRLRFELPTEPAKGFRWTAKAIDASHLEQLGKGVMPENGRLDAAGTQVFVWKAISPGNANIGMEYSRPNDDRTVAPAKQIRLQVEVVAGELAPVPTGADELLTPTLAPLANYEGTRPCADCIGLAVELHLFVPYVANDTSKDVLKDGAHGRAAKQASQATAGVFMEIRRYKGAPGGDKTIAETGKFAVVHGTYADPSLNVYVFGRPGGGTDNYQVETDRLVPLDPQGLPLPRAPGGDQSLHRVETEDLVTH